MALESPKIDICQNGPQGALGDVSSCLETKFDKEMSMGSVPNCRKEIANRYGIRWFKCKLKPPKNDRVKTRLLIQFGLFELLLFEIERKYGYKQPYLELMYKAMFGLAYYGLLKLRVLIASRLRVSRLQKTKIKLCWYCTLQKHMERSQDHKNCRFQHLRHWAKGRKIFVLSKLLEVIWKWGAVMTHPVNSSSCFLMDHKWHLTTWDVYSGI